MAGEHAKKEYVRTPIFMTSELHHGLVESYRLNSLTLNTSNNQTPPDLVVKLQLIDIFDVNL